MNGFVPEALAVTAVMILGLTLMELVALAVSSRSRTADPNLRPPASFALRAWLPNLVKFAASVGIFVAFVHRSDDTFAHNVWFWATRGLPFFAFVALFRTVDDVRAMRAYQRLRNGAEPADVVLPPHSRGLGAFVAVAFVALAVMAVVAVMKGDSDVDLDLPMTRARVEGATFAYPKGWTSDPGGGYQTEGSFGPDIDSLASYSGRQGTRFDGTYISVSRTPGSSVQAIKRAVSGPLTGALEEVTDEYTVSVSGAEEALVQRVEMAAPPAYDTEAVRLLVPGSNNSGYIVSFTTWEGQLDAMMPLAERIFESFRVAQDAT